jgi:protein-tyrosine phosphatase
VLAVADTIADRTLSLGGCFNFRDLGGYVTTDGRQIRWRRLFRADGPHALTADDIAIVGDLGLATVLDLRTVDEAADRGRWSDVVGTAVLHHFPMMDVLPVDRELEGWSEATRVARHYGEMLERGAPAIAQALELLARQSTYPAMFHCSAGKDRTGVLAALVLGLVGVPDETIVADYALSRQAMARLLEWLRQTVEDPARLERYAPAVLAAQPEVMAEFLDIVSERYGGFDRYANALGVPDAAEALRSALLSS